MLFYSTSANRSRELRSSDHSWIGSDLHFPSEVKQSVHSPLKIRVETEEPSPATSYEQSRYVAGCTGSRGRIGFDESGGQSQWLPSKFDPDSIGPEFALPVNSGLNEAQHRIERKSSSGKPSQALCGRITVLDVRQFVGDYCLGFIRRQRCDEFR